MRRTHRAVVAAIALTLLSALLVVARAAEEAAGTLEITVLDLSGKPLPSVVVEVEAKTVHRSASSGANGKAVIAGLPPGHYRVTVPQGLLPFDAGNINVEPNTTAEFPLYLPPSPAIGSPPPIRPSLEISEITLERTGCAGECPVYSLTLCADESSRYFGGAHAALTGRAYGKIRHQDFLELVHMAERIRFFDLRPRYGTEAAAERGTITSVVRSGVRTTVENNGEAGPLELEGFEAAIDVVFRRSAWATDFDENDLVPHPNVEMVPLAALGSGCSLTWQWIGRTPDLKKGLWLECGRAKFLVREPLNLLGQVSIQNETEALEFVRLFSNTEAAGYVTGTEGATEWMVEVVPKGTNGGGKLIEIDRNVFHDHFHEAVVRLWRLSLGEERDRKLPYHGGKEFEISRVVLCLDGGVYAVRETVTERGFYELVDKKLILKDGKAVGAYLSGDE